VWISEEVAMRECRVLWARYETAMGLCRQAHNDAERGAWWAEAQEWLRRYFDAVEGELERQASVVPPARR
jgi:hypothetical protein